MTKEVENTSGTLLTEQLKVNYGQPGLGTSEGTEILNKADMPQTTGVQESTEVMGNTNTPEDDSQEALESAQFRDNTDTSYDDNQEGWLYVGHGEWIQVEQDEAPSQEGVPLKAQPQWIQQWLKNNDLDIKLNEDVLSRDTQIDGELRLK